MIEKLSTETLPRVFPRKILSGKTPGGFSRGGFSQLIHRCYLPPPLNSRVPLDLSTGALASASAVEMWALTSPALAITMVQIQEATATSDDNDDTDEEKAQLDAYKGVMWGLHTASHTLSEGYQRACLEVQGLVNQSLSLSTEKDRMFVAEASTALCRWVKAVQPAIDCLGKSMLPSSPACWRMPGRRVWRSQRRSWPFIPWRVKRNPLTPSMILWSGPLMRPGGISRRPSCPFTGSCQCLYINMYHWHKPVFS